MLFAILGRAGVFGHDECESQPRALVQCRLNSPIGRNSGQHNRIDAAESELGGAGLSRTNFGDDERRKDGHVLVAEAYHLATEIVVHELHD